MAFASAGMPWGFTLDINQDEGEQEIAASFDANRYNPHRVRDFVERYAETLEIVARRPDCLLGQLAKRVLPSCSGLQDAPGDIRGRCNATCDARRRN